MFFFNPQTNMTNRSCHTDWPLVRLDPVALGNGRHHKRHPEQIPPERTRPARHAIRCPHHFIAVKLNVRMTDAANQQQVRKVRLRSIRWPFHGCFCLGCRSSGLSIMSHSRFFPMISSHLYSSGPLTSFMTWSSRRWVIVTFQPFVQVQNLHFCIFWSLIIFFFFFHARDGDLLTPRSS